METFDWKDLLGIVSRGKALSYEQAAFAMDAILHGEVSDAQIAGLVVGMRVRGETSEEIHGMVDMMMKHAVAVTADRMSVDVVGTGGDGAHSVNISTMAAIVVAGTGTPVLKHGNRAVSSKTGTADVLERLGVAVPLPTATVSSCLANAGIAFCFAPEHHPALKYAGPVRRELGIPTVFNVLGPLANPGQPAAALIGCADLRLAPVLAQVQATRGMQSIIVRGDDGLDELTTATTSQIWDVTSGEVLHSVLDPRALGLTVAGPDELRGGDAAFNAQVIKDILDARTDGKYQAIRDVVALNAAAALVAFDASVKDYRYGSVQLPVAQRIYNALPDAFDSIDSGSASSVLSVWVSVSQRLALMNQQ